MALQIVGPTEDYYNELLTGLESHLRSIEIFERIEQMEKALRELERSLEIRSIEQTPEEVLDEKDEESPTNNSSALTLITYKGSRYLFTADAGPESFRRAFQSYPLEYLNWMQVPHHGSRRNLTSDLVSRLHPTYAYVSAGGGDDKKHPNPNVVQALKNVECTVYGTNKSGNL